VDGDAVPVEIEHAPGGVAAIGTLGECWRWVIQWRVIQRRVFRQREVASAAWRGVRVVHDC
jgi:hypothetical protein